MPKLLELHTPPQSCRYLPDQLCSLEVRLIDRLDGPAYARMLERGWRRQGTQFFRPACPACRQCYSLRVPLAMFRPSKSQRRATRRNPSVRVKLSRPDVSSAHVQLFNAYHQDMQRRRGWPYHETDSQSYTASFLQGDFGFAWEFQYYRRDQLLGVGLVDMTQQESSSIYFYHDPAWRANSPGVYSLIRELREARHRGLCYHYLGYYIPRCQSMSYKIRYRPNEFLHAYVPDAQRPRWLPGEKCEDAFS